MKCRKPELQTFRRASSGTGERPRSGSGTPRGTLAAQPPTTIVLFTSRKDAFGAAHETVKFTAWYLVRNRQFSTATRQPGSTDASGPANQSPRNWQLRT